MSEYKDPLFFQSQDDLDTSHIRTSEENLSFSLAKASERERLLEEQGYRLETGSLENSNAGKRNLEASRLLIKRVAILSFLLIIFVGVAVVLITHHVVKDLPDVAPILPMAHELLSNGTHIYKPTVILISLDGFRVDYLERGLTPNLVKLGQKGLMAEYLKPVFPSVTFPNHYTLVTGLYPESHGIVGNTFFDPELNDTFIYTQPGNSLDSKWWGGEPIWITATLQNCTSAVLMWPGGSSFIKGIRANYVVDYDNTWGLDRKNEQILNWLDMPLDERPQIITVYVSNVDSAGHRGGPDSTEVNVALQSVDGMIGSLVDELMQRNLTDVVNLAIVSDHGMTSSSRDRLISVENLIDPADLPYIGIAEGWPLLGIRPTDPSRINSIYNSMKRASEMPNSHFKVYLRNDIPERWHFASNKRIADILAVPDLGWVFVTSAEFDINGDDDYNPRGIHGYDNDEPDMQALFIATGPGFVAKSARDGYLRTMRTGTVKGFLNLEIYGVLTRILGLMPAANNGSLGGIFEEIV